MNKFQQGKGVVMNMGRWLKTHDLRQAGSFERFRLHIIYCSSFFDVFAHVPVLGQSVLGVSFTMASDR